MIAKIRRKIKDVAITTDVLIGFPGEQEENFAATINCLKEIMPLRTHLFSFSPREGTRAFTLGPSVDVGMVRERMKMFKMVASECSYEFRKRFLGRQLRVLIESQPDKISGLLCGYSENYIRVIVEDATKGQINTLLPVAIKAVDRSATKACTWRGV